MHYKSLSTLFLSCLLTCVSCSQEIVPEQNNQSEDQTNMVSIVTPEPHRYGGWYCPDNLGGFPAVDIYEWENVPVVNGRMPTQEETRNGTSLIDVDLEKYPNAKPLDMTMPRLARYQSRHSGKNEIVIVIQAVNVSNDSVVGFRYLNGGNGSAWLSEVEFISNEEVEAMPESRFVSMSFNIDAPKDEIWNVLTGAAYYDELRAIFDENSTPETVWDNTANVNFKYLRASNITSEYAGDLFGNQYIQIDFEKGDYQYVEKFLVGIDQETNSSELVIVCGPYRDDYETQKSILENWAQKVKELSEKG